MLHPRNELSLKLAELLRLLERHRPPQDSLRLHTRLEQGTDCRLQSGKRESSRQLLLPQ